LARYKHAEKLTDEKIGLELGLDRTHILRLRKGQRSPSLTTALKIQEWSKGKIPVEAWGTVAA